MYKYVSSLVLDEVSSSSWVSPDLENVLLEDVFNRYKRAYLTITHSSSPKELYIDLISMKYSISNGFVSVGHWLQLLGNQPLPLIEKLPEGSVGFVRYTELSRAGYMVNYATEGYHYAKGVDTRGMKDLSVSREGTDMRFVNRHCLATVNGFIHDTSATFDHLYLRGGGSSSRRADKHTSGLITFDNIGEITRHRLSDIQPVEKDSTLFEKLRFKVPDYNPSHAYFLVLGGYLVFRHPDYFFMSGAREFTLDLTQLYYIDRLLESSLYLDLKPLEITQPDNMSQPGIPLDEAMSDRVVRNYLSLSQTFFVEVHTDNLHVFKQPRMPEPYPNRYLSCTRPTEPLMGGYGRLLEYWPIEGKSSWILDCNDNYRNNFQYTASGHARVGVVDVTQDITNRDRISGAYALEISSFK